MRLSSNGVICFLAIAACPAATALAAQQENPDFAAQKEAVGQALDTAVGVMFKPGAQDPNWNKNGVDLEALVKARPNQMLVEIDKDGERSIAIYSDKRMAELIPPEWELIAEIGQDVPDADSSEAIEISELEDGYYVASRSTEVRVGDAFCSDVPNSAQLYRVRGATAVAMSPEIANSFFTGCWTG